MAQIIRITSEALQATVRRLLPSQVGFGEDLQASNVIQPIIDLTPTAEGSQLDTDLARAVSYGGSTVFNSTGAIDDIITTAGFYRVHGTATLKVDSTSIKGSAFDITDGVTPKEVWAFVTLSGIAGEIITEAFDFNVFLRTGDTFRAYTDANTIFRGSFWQIADVYGNITNPAGFTFE